MESKENPLGPMTGIILIVLVLLIGAWYFLWQKIVKLEDQKENPPVATTTTRIINLGTTTEMVNATTTK